MNADRNPNTNNATTPTTMIATTAAIPSFKALPAKKSPVIIDLGMTKIKSTAGLNEIGYLR